MLHSDESPPGLVETSPEMDSACPEYPVVSPFYVTCGSARTIVWDMYVIRRSVFHQRPFAFIFAASGRGRGRHVTYLQRFGDVQICTGNIMNRLVYVLFAFSCFFAAVFLGAILIFSALGNVSSISTLLEFLGVCLFVNAGIIAIWLGWWVKRVVTGRRGLVFGWNREPFFIKPIRPEAKINGFRHQAACLFGSLTIIVVLIYLNMAT